MYYSEQPAFDHTSDIEITSDSNIISYDQYMKEIKSEVVPDTISPEQQNDMIMSVIDEMSNQDAKCDVENITNRTVSESLTTELERYKEQIKMFEERQKSALVDYQKIEKSYVDEYNECLELMVELSKKNEMVKKVVYNELSKKCSRLENHCISLEIEKQQLKESFQSPKPCQNKNAPEFKEFFEFNNLKAQAERVRTRQTSTLKKTLLNL
ncbi:hypothetical protein Tco_0748287 [Tanacetum coccineum]|uniref:Uncharacterized protein n=1 Tax=Tanacetum coccineum TaxID=301880 RepID=A0ABQ4YWD1_9ASTR